MLLDGVWKSRKDPHGTGEEEGWFSPDFDDSGWDDMPVPSHWQEHAGYEGYDGIVWYRKDFEAGRREGKRYWLILHGVFYRGKVWLNGCEVGRFEGYFFPHRFDVTESLRDGRNVLAIKVESYDERDLNRKRQVGGVLYHWDCRDNFFNPGGIWRSVELVETGPVIIERAKVLAELDGSVKIRLWMNSSKEGKVRIRIRVSPKNFEGREVSLEKTLSVATGTSEYVVNLKVPEPRLWWTWDHGFPHLYVAEIVVFWGDEQSHSIRETFGIRKFEAKGHYFYLNGKRIYLRGTNYGPGDNRMAKITRDLVRKDVRMMKEMNVNAVRIHAHVEPREFYETCDEEGILVWQDFPLQWFYDTKRKKEYVRQAREMVRVLENHPSVGIWCAHNEPATLWGAGRIVAFAVIAYLLGALVSAITGTLAYRSPLLTSFIRAIFGLRIPTAYDLLGQLFEPVIVLPVVPGLAQLTIDLFTLISLFLLLVLFSRPFALDPLVTGIMIAVNALLFPPDMLLTAIAFLVAVNHPIAAWHLTNSNRRMDKAIVKAIKEEDLGQRPVIPYSGFMGWILKGTSIHVYHGWYTAYDGFPWTLLPRRLRGYRYVKMWRSRIFRNVPKIVVEFGAQSLPSEECTRKMLGDKLFNELMEEKKFRELLPLLGPYLHKRHQYQYWLWERIYRPKEVRNIKELIERSQQYQAELTRFYIEFLRSMKYRPNSVVMQFMFVDIFPGVTWAVVDYCRKPKKAYFEAKKAFRPVNVIADWPAPEYKTGEVAEFSIYVVNDTYAEVRGVVEAVLAYEDGRKDVIWSREVVVPEDGIVTFSKAVKFRVERGMAGLIVRMRLSDGRVIESDYRMRIR